MRSVFLIQNLLYTEIKVLEDNADLESALQKISLPVQKINKLEVDGISKYYLFFTPNFSLYEQERNSCYLKTYGVISEFRSRNSTVEGFFFNSVLRH